MKFQIGQFVYSLENNLGIGKVSDIKSDSIRIEYFDSPTLSKQPSEIVAKASVHAIKICTQTRAYLFDKEAKAWRAGRVIDNNGSKYLIQLPNKIKTAADEIDFFVRWYKPIKDPIAHLAYRINETPFFHTGRSRFVKSLLYQRGAFAGMTGLVSSAIELEKHQIEVVRRVMQDPIQRYLLADEVGLGKTIEAGVLIKQYVLDAPQKHSVLIVVPEHLVEQWIEELYFRFFLKDQLGQTVHVLPSRNFKAVEKIGKDAGMLVIDEAHHAASFYSSSDKNELRIFEAIKKISHKAERLLLLSATPLLHHERDFLTMLHLLDPTIYSLDGLKAFKDRVEKRQALAESFYALTENTPNYFIEKIIDDLLQCFSSDSRLSKLTSNLKKHLGFDTPEDSPERSQAILAIRTHVSETYRLHRRMLRNRRSEDLEMLLPGRDGIAIKFYNDLAQEQIDELIDEWRIKASAKVYGCESPEELSNFSNLFTLLIEASTSDSMVLGRVATARLNSVEGNFENLALTSHELQLIKTPSIFASEKDIWLKIREILSLNDLRTNRLNLLTQIIKTNINSGEKIVIFCTHPVTADNIFIALKEKFNQALVRHTANASIGGQRPEWHRFRNDPNCKILVCDRAAEEGLNLQGGKIAIIHCDLPFSPNRIEQRMGRLDRYGTGEPIKSFALLSNSSLIAKAWCECLDQSFNVFRRSIASLQYLVEEQMQKLGPQLLFEGAQAIDELKNALSGEDGIIAKELKRIKAQDQLDAIEESLTENDFIDNLNLADSEWQEIQKAIEKWIVDRLHFTRQTVADHNSNVFRYQYQNLDQGINTLVPIDELINRFQNVVDKEAPNFNYLKPVTHHLSYKRQTALHKKTRIARIGEPFIDAMSNYVHWDDRGTCFAMWRHCPKVKLKDPAELVFRFDFIVEADVSFPLASVVKQNRATPEAITRLGDNLFPPIMKTIWINDEFQLVDDELRLNILNQDYYPGEGGDYNLNPERWEVIEQTYDSVSWHSMCQRAFEVAQGHLKDQIRLDDLILLHQKQTKKLFSIHLEQLKSRLLYLDKKTMMEESKQINAEEKLYKEMEKAVLKPLIRLDAVGAIFISANNPFLLEANPFRRRF